LHLKPGIYQNAGAIKELIEYKEAPKERSRPFSKWAEVLGV
jgi:hypothetical protein